MRQQLNTSNGSMRVRFDHGSSSRGCRVIEYLTITREIGMLASGKVATMPAPAGKILALVRHHNPASEAWVVLMLDDLIPARTRLTLNRSEG